MSQVSFIFPFFFLFFVVVKTLTILLQTIFLTHCCIKDQGTKAGMKWLVLPRNQFPSIEDIRGELENLFM